MLCCLFQFVADNNFTIQLLGREDHVSDNTITSEEKWSLYVDQFVQLSSTENLNSKLVNPFLKRNLPAHVGEEPPLNVETKSGLELKICVNTYKIFFVDNTEDYFRRRAPMNRSSLGLLHTEQDVSLTEKRKDRFIDWLEGPNGWRAGMVDDEALKLIQDFRNWISTDAIA
jgi:paired amphipathic helix protein Sin3a